VVRTPGGEVEIDLEVEASPEHGTVDWRMTFPERSVATAFSRVVEMDRERCIFSFVLTPPPVSLEQLAVPRERRECTTSEGKACRCAADCA
jgi:hypothetical protein